jgi:cytochrome c oxidase subunit II
MTHLEAGCDDGFQLYCTEYCGDDHSKMWAKVFVYETEAEWAAAVKKAGDLKNITDLVDRGKYIYSTQCISCHSVDGSQVPNGGPSWKGLWGKKETVIAGEEEMTVTIDKGYIRESVITPGAKVVKGYNNVMTPFDWGAQNDIALEGIYAYLESLKDE